MPEPKTLNATPSGGLCMLGAAFGAILASALIHLAPLLGLPLVDVPLLIGALFSADPDIAFFVGHLLHLLGAVAAAPLAVFLWHALPGKPRSFGGAALKGLCFGGGLFVVAGLVVPLVESLAGEGAAGLPALGPFALSQGLGGAVVLLVASLAYGLVVALIGAAGRSLSMIDTLGWDSTGKQADIGGAT